MSGPRVFGLPHLSEDAVAAFADGVLSASAASRARRHCAECAECADAVRIQREAAMLLRTAQAPALPSGLLDRLAGLPMSTPLPPPRGGLPTVLGADGTPVFVAHDVHKALSAGEHPDAGPSDEPPPRPMHRRGALPVTVLASAAAVVAAGTFGGHVSTLAASSTRPPVGAAQVAGAFTGSQNPAGRNPAGQSSAGQSSASGESSASGGSSAGGHLTLPPPGSLIGTGTVLDTGVRVAGSATSAGDPTNPPSRHPPLPVSVAVAPQPHRHPGVAPSMQMLLAGFGPMAAGAPAATP